MQIKERDEIIYKLKQETSSLKEKIYMVNEKNALLAAENEWLRSRQLVKQETGN